MTTATATNLDSLTQQVKKEISLAITKKTITEVIIGYFRDYVSTEKEVRSLRWYFATLSNTKSFLGNPRYFNEFKTKYQLQWIDNVYLDRLGQERERILDLIRNDDLQILYDEFFRKARTAPNKFTNQNVFFTKLVHTFRPADYCVLDSKVTKYFGLQKAEREDFLKTFKAVSRAYKQWATENRTLVQQLRHVVKMVDKNRLFEESMTDLKLLDLVFFRSKKLPKSKGKM